MYAVTLYAQQHTKLLKQWYDQERHQLKREYSVLIKKPHILEGPYKAYFNNGRLQSEGQYKQNRQTGTWGYYYENGHLRMKGAMLEGKTHALWHYYYENGKLSQSGEWEKGVKNGSWKYYYENGGVRSEGLILHDKYEGLWKYYYEDGKIKATALFEGGVGAYKEYYPSGKLKMQGNITEGKSEGVWQYYYENGSLKAEGLEKNGQREDLWKFYHSNGQLSGEGNYLEGQTVGKWKYYHQNGQLSAEGEEIQGQRQGYWKLYYESGKFKAEGTFSVGDGLYKEFYESGKLKLTGNLQKGKSAGSWKYYYEDGILEGSCFFKDGEGMYSGFHKNGQLKMQGKIKDGQRVDTWTLYNEDGTLAGHYSAFYEEDLSKLFISEEITTPTDTVQEPSSAKKPDIVLRKKKLRYFTPAINETRTVIVSVNPLALLIGSLPVSAEYYMQERQGVEIGILLHKQPFFSRPASMPPGETFRSGITAHLRHKFYHPGRYLDTWYFGHELRLSAQTNGFIQNDTLQGNSQRSKVLLYEKRLEYSILVGSRIFKPLGKDGLSLDIYTGLGLGYRHFQKGWDIDKDSYSRQFPVLHKPAYYFPFRIGLSFGYYF